MESVTNFDTTVNEFMHARAMCASITTIDGASPPPRKPIGAAAYDQASENVGSNEESQPITSADKTTVPYSRSNTSGVEGSQTPSGVFFKSGYCANAHEMDKRKNNGGDKEREEEEEDDASRMERQSGRPCREVVDCESEVDIGDDNGIFAGSMATEDECIGEGSVASPQIGLGATRFFLPRTQGFSEDASPIAQPPPSPTSVNGRAGRGLAADEEDLEQRGENMVEATEMLVSPSEPGDDSEEILLTMQATNFFDTSERLGGGSRRCRRAPATAAAGGQYEEENASPIACKPKEAASSSPLPRAARPTFGENLDMDAAHAQVEASMNNEYVFIDYHDGTAFLADASPQLDGSYLLGQTILLAQSLEGSQRRAARLATTASPVPCTPSSTPMPHQERLRCESHPGRVDDASMSLSASPGINPAIAAMEASASVNLTAPQPTITRVVLQNARSQAPSRTDGADDRLGMSFSLANGSFVFDQTLLLSCSARPTGQQQRSQATSRCDGFSEAASSLIFHPVALSSGASVRRSTYGGESPLPVTPLDQSQVGSPELRLREAKADREGRPARVRVVPNSSVAMTPDDITSMGWMPVQLGTPDFMRRSTDYDFGRGGSSPIPNAPHRTAPRRNHYSAAAAREEDGDKRDDDTVGSEEDEFAQPLREGSLSRADQSMSISGVSVSTVDSIQRRLNWSSLSMSNWNPPQQRLGSPSSTRWRDSLPPGTPLCMSACSTTSSASTVLCSPNGKTGGRSSPAPIAPETAEESAQRENSPSRCGESLLSYSVGSQLQHHQRQQQDDFIGPSSLLTSMSMQHSSIMAEYYVTDTSMSLPLTASGVSERDSLASGAVAHPVPIVVGANAIVRAHFAAQQQRQQFYSRRVSTGTTTTTATITSMTASTMSSVTALGAGGGGSSSAGDRSARLANNSFRTTYCKRPSAGPTATRHFPTNMSSASLSSASAGLPVTRGQLFMAGSFSNANTTSNSGSLRLMHHASRGVLPTKANKTHVPSHNNNNNNNNHHSKGHAKGNNSSSRQQQHHMDLFDSVSVPTASTNTTISDNSCASSMGWVRTNDIKEFLETPAQSVSIATGAISEIKDEEDNAAAAGHGGFNNTQRRTTTQKPDTSVFLPWSPLTINPDCSVNLPSYTAPTLPPSPAPSAVRDTRLGDAHPSQQTQKQQEVSGASIVINVDDSDSDSDSSDDADDEDEDDMVHTCMARSDAPERSGLDATLEGGSGFTLPDSLSATVMTTAMQLQGMSVTINQFTQSVAGLAASAEPRLPFPSSSSSSSSQQQRNNKEMEEAEEPQARPAVLTGKENADSSRSVSGKRPTSSAPREPSLRTSTLLNQ